MQKASKPSFWEMKLDSQMQDMIRKKLTANLTDMSPKKSEVSRGSIPSAF